MYYIKKSSNCNMYRVHLPYKAPTYIILFESVLAHKYVYEGLLHSPLLQQHLLVTFKMLVFQGCCYNKVQSVCNKFIQINE